MAAYVEITAGGGADEFGALEVHPDGSATVFAGTLSHGQGHQTAYAMLVSDQTGIPIDRITLVDGDTDLVRTGGGTGGSRSLQLGGSAVQGATEAMVDSAKELAARLLEADVADIVVDTTTGTVGVAGVPAQALTWAELASRAADDGAPLAGEFDFHQDGATFPFGAHIAVVEVDSDTGKVRLVRHVAVDDCGTVLNPLLVEGQQHGGIAAGVGQALFEEIVYDGDGNPITSNLAEYAMPSAAELPSFEVHSTETPTPLNPLGAKGIGEAATIGSTPAVQNAVIDALAHLGVRHIDLPCTSERVWRTIVAARERHVARPVARATGRLRPTPRRRRRPARPTTRSQPRPLPPPTGSDPSPSLDREPVARAEALTVGHERIGAQILVREGASNRDVEQGQLAFQGGVPFRWQVDDQVGDQRPHAPADLVLARPERADLVEGEGHQVVP